MENKPPSASVEVNADVSASINVAALREEYTRAHLRRRDLDPDPFAQFNRWLADAVAAGIKDPNAMALATVNAAGQPSSRIVLLKGVSAEGFVFYTNYTSHKALDLETNPRAALNFYWVQLERQVCVTGLVCKGSREDAAKYFHSRPAGSQLGAWASHQSQIVPSRDNLEAHLAAAKKKFADGEIPLPEFWGGYVLAPQSIEFWQGGANRIHDRLRYTGGQGGWVIDRLSP